MVEPPGDLSQGPSRCKHAVMEPAWNRLIRKKSRTPSRVMIFVKATVKMNSTENLNRVFSRYTWATRETTELPQAIKMDTHVTSKYTSIRWQEHNAIGRALPRNADP